VIYLKSGNKPGTENVDEQDIGFIRKSFEIARSARNKGNHPFGALLVDEQGQILMEAENTVISSKDCTGHAETNLMRMASSKFNYEYLARCTIYTSTEPCPMCSGAIFWANVRRVVYGLSMGSLYEIVGGDTQEALYLPCRQLFEKGKKQVEVVGPLLEDEAHEVHKDFWK
jgi:tRNA(Arg) A34 adenosine deaminase TadA